MKIAYVTTYDSKNIRNWSGLGYYIGKTLKEQFNDITCVANLQEPYTSVQKGKRTIYNNIFNKNI
jgi:hypothetical protein